MFLHFGLDADFEERRSPRLAFQSRHSTTPRICLAGWLLHDFEYAYAAFSGPTATCIQSQKVRAWLRHLNREQRQTTVDRAGYKLIEFLAIVIRAVLHRGISKTQLGSELDGLGRGQA